MDYDRSTIPTGYDRSREHGPEWLDRWMEIVAFHVAGRAVRRILDLGCGTGRFTGGLARRFGVETIGIDPSAKMLAQARAKSPRPTVHYQRAAAEALPLETGSVDLIFMSMSFHHFSDPAAAARECRRVLRDDGTVLLRTGTREQILSYPYVPFFPGTPAIMQEVLPDIPEVRDVFESAGFLLFSAEIVTQTIASGWAAYADKLAAGGDSDLARLSQRDFERGLAAIKGHAERHDPEPVVEPIDLLVFRT